MKKYILLFLCLLMIISTTSCNKESYDKVEIYQTDNDIVKISKETINELHKYSTKDMALYGMIQINDEFSESIIIKDGDYQLYTETVLDYICLYMNGRNYFYTYDNEIIEANPDAPSFYNPLLEKYYQLVDLTLNNSSKFTYKKQEQEDSTISYILSSTDIEFIKNNYKKIFQDFEILNLINDKFEIVYTFDKNKNLTQIDFFGTDKNNENTIEIALIFEKNINNAYNTLGENFDEIWDFVKTEMQ